MLLFHPGNFKLDCTAMCVRPCYLCQVTEVEEVDAETVREIAEGELRGWAMAHKITAKTVDLFVKDGFSSMDAV
jgi:hypothetical protein